MIKQSALSYYIQSIFDLISYTSWWKVPLLLWQKPVLLTVSTRLKFMVWNLMDIWTLKEVILDGHYEQVERISNHSTVIDVGGSIGDFSVFAQTYRNAKVVHSFEPNENRIQLFQQNQLLNRCHRGQLHPVAATSLEQIFKITKLQTCDFMKVDCEGAEYDIFAQPSAKHLKKIKHIVFEVHFFSENMRAQYQHLCYMLQKHGFRLIEKSNPVHDTIGFLYATNQKFA